MRKDIIQTNKDKMVYINIEISCSLPTIKIFTWKTEIKFPQKFYWKRKGMQKKL